MNRLTLYLPETNEGQIFTRPLIQKPTIYSGKRLNHMLDQWFRVDTPEEEPELHEEVVITQMAEKIVSHCMLPVV